MEVFGQSSSNSQGGHVPKLRFPGFDGEYRTVALGDISVKVVRTDPNSKAPVMMISAASGFINQSVKYSRENAGQSLKKYTLLKRGELAYNHGASKLRQFGCCFELKEAEARIPYVYHTFSISKSEFAPYIALLLNNPIMDRQLKRMVSSSVRMDGLLNISFDEYMSIKLRIPALIAEQEKIYAFVELLDQRIEKQRQLVEALKSYKRGVSTALFTQKLRVQPSDNTTYAEWKGVPLGEVFCERTERATGTEKLLAVTINSGIQDRDDLELKDNSSENKQNYRVVHIGDLAYNTMRMWQGACGVSAFHGIVSPAYTVLSVNNPAEHYVPYFGYLFKETFMLQLFQRNSQGLTSDTWNLKYDKFARINVTVPRYAEQVRISSFLERISDEIAKQEKVLNMLTKYKRGLLESMFI